MNDASHRIGVLVGGISGQRELSLRSADAILGALADHGHDAVPLYVDRDIDQLLRQTRIGTAFIALQGRYGEDGCIQGLLEVLGIPYTGSGVLASSLAMNRAKTKEILRLHNLPTAACWVFDGESDDGVIELHGSFGYPVMVRPLGTRSLVGTTLVNDEVDLEAAVESALRFGDQAIIERHVAGREICVGLLDGEPLGALEIHRSGGHHGAGTGGGRISAGFPTKLSAERYRALLRLGGLAYEALGCDGPACVQLSVSDKGNEIVLDIDTQPVLTPDSVLARVARTAGLPFADLVERILEGARLRAHGRRRNRRLAQASFEGPERRTGYAASAH